MDEFIGIVKLFAGPFAPQGWAFCDGSLLNISQYQALFSVISTTYGGNGTQNFALPDLRSRVAVGAGNVPGQPPVVAGHAGGSASVTLTAQQLPMHTHAQQFSTGAATTNMPAAGLASAQTDAVVPASTEAVTANIYGPANNLVAGAQTGAAGSSQPIATMPPFLGMNYIICLQGLYPNRPS